MNWKTLLFVLMTSLLLASPASAKSETDKTDARIAALETAVADLQLVVTTQGGEIGMLQTDLFAATARISALEAEISTLQDSMSTAQSAIGTLETGLGAAMTDITDLEARPIFDLEPFVSVSYDSINALAGPHILFEGANIHVRSGSGSTDDGGGFFGLGNLIVGYNEGGGNRGGSHNVVIGKAHQYSSYGGFVAGYRNQLHAASGSINGGFENTVTGIYTSVLGGHFNTAESLATSVSGGLGNLSSNHYSSISGGYSNRTLGPTSTVGGGAFRTTSGDRDWAAGSLYEDE